MNIRISPINRQELLAAIRICFYPPVVLHLPVRTGVLTLKDNSPDLYGTHHAIIWNQLYGLPSSAKQRTDFVL